MRSFGTFGIQSCHSCAIHRERGTTGVSASSCANPFPLVNPSCASCATCHLYMPFRGDIGPNAEREAAGPTQGRPSHPLKSTETDQDRVAVVSLSALMPARRPRSWRNHVVFRSGYMGSQTT